MQEKRIVVVAALVAVVMTCAPLWAAHLTVIDKKEFRSGPESQGVHLTAQLTDPSGILVSTFASTGLLEDAPDVATCTTAAAGATYQFQIDPEPGEQVGDRVVVKYTWQANASATVSSGEFGAQANVGSGTLTNTCYPLNLSFAQGMTIVHDPLGSPTVELSYAPPELTAPPNPVALADSGDGVFPAVIGDVIQLDTGSYAGVEWTGAAAGSASASAGSQIQLELKAVGAVPMLSWVGLGALAVLLAAAAAFALRR